MILVFGDRSWPAVVADPDWQDQSVSVNEANHAMRSVLIEFIKEGLGAKQSYVEHCIPKFPVWGKRLIVDNGWYETLAREDVTLVPHGIDRVTETGIVSADGAHHDLDVLILATGFESNRLLSPMRVLGLGGQELSEVWGDAANAYKGTTVPGFPNLFCLYGPNTNIVHGGSIIYQIECQIHYVMQCLTVLAAGEGRALDVRSEVNSTYNESVQSLSAGLAWGHPSVDSWYKNKAGQVVNNSPFSLQKFWAVTHDFDESDYRLLSHGVNE
jgi:4-hydroxyacetophenone monooxygenase